jgi:hypothetical protein
MTEDEKIHDVVIASIRRHSISPEKWRNTCIAGLHQLFAKEFSLQSGEFVVASAKISSNSWYIFTTRRLVSCFKGRQSEARLSELKESEFGNFKGYGSNPNLGTTILTEVATLNFSNDLIIQFEYETGKASMAPIYATKYWQQKNLSRLTK